MINMLRALMDKINITEQIGNLRRNGNPKKEPKRNDRDKNRNKECIG